MTVTPVAGLAHQTPDIPGQAVNAIAANQVGGYITNPSSAADQGLTTAESLFVNPVGAAQLQANDTTVELKPGQTYPIIPSSVQPVSVASASAAHKFTSVQWS
jgi:hypothetical protein